MPDYQKMYTTLVNETEKAINILINAQRKCEEMYIREENNVIDLQESENK